LDADGATARRSHVVNDESPGTGSSAHAECRRPQQSSTSNAGRRLFAPPRAVHPHRLPAAMLSAALILRRFVVQHAAPAKRFLA